MFNDNRLLLGLLLLFIGCVAVGHVAYVVRHLARSPDCQKGIQTAPPTFEYSRRQLYISLATLVGLAAFAIFIFTPTAATLHQRPGFILSALALIGGWAIFTVVRARWTGGIAPVFMKRYRRFKSEEHPFRYRSTMVANGLIGILCLGTAWAIGPTNPRFGLYGQCRHPETAASRADALSACDRLIDAHDGSTEQLASLLTSRGVVHLQMHDEARAIADHLRALDLDPTMATAHFNLGAIHERRGDRKRAFQHFDAAIRTGSQNGHAFLSRGTHHLDHGDHERAVADFTKAHSLLPQSPGPLALRGLAHALLRNDRDAIRDLDAAAELDPHDGTILHGRVQLAVNQGRREAAMKLVEAAYNRDPNDEETADLRAELLRVLGDKGQSQPIPGRP